MRNFRKKATSNRVSTNRRTTTHLGLHNGLVADGPPLELDRVVDGPAQLEQRLVGRVLQLDLRSGRVAQGIVGAALVDPQIGLGRVLDGQHVVALVLVALDQSHPVDLEIVAVLEPVDLAHGRMRVDYAADVGLDALAGVEARAFAPAVVAQVLLVVLHLRDVCVGEGITIDSLGCRWNLAELGNTSLKYSRV